MIGLPMFAFPDGMRLEMTANKEFPMPLFFTFVFTDADGKHFYVACLQFYEVVELNDLREVCKTVHGEDAVSNLQSHNTPNLIAYIDSFVPISDTCCA